MKTHIRAHILLLFIYIILERTNYFIVAKPCQFPSTGVEKGVDCKGHEDDFGGEGIMLYLNCGGAHTAEYVFQNFSNYSLDECNLFYINYTPILLIPFA